ncbi:MAG: hypothetical protein GY847_26760 [Proteobacteria bacterium]|nr:hypothetical protein [Pseudomonadota bacterium]
MAKTVFGMPGVGNELEGGGDVVAPGGAPGAKQKGELPQKSGKETPTPEKETMEESSKPSAKQSDPPLVKPAAVPAANPPGGQAGDGKTMFGMPAMKLPLTPGASPKGTKPSATTMATPSQPPGAQSKTPSSKPGAPEDDAYKATILGMAAVTPSTGGETAPYDEVETSPETDQSSPVVQDGNLGGTGANSTDYSSQISTASRELSGRGYRFDSESQRKFPLWLIIVIIAVVAVAVILIAHFVLKAPEPPAEGTTGTLEEQTEGELSRVQTSAPVLLPGPPLVYEKKITDWKTTPPGRES